MADERLTLREAAARLGVSESAIRKRVERGTLRTDKGDDGRRYVYLDNGADDVSDTGADTSDTGERDALISHLQDEIEYLRDENRRKDEIIMQQAISMRALAAPTEQQASEHPPEPRESPVTATEQPGREEPQAPIEERQEPAEPRRSWWGRIFGY